jgi:hypothetical protein
MGEAKASSVSEGVKMEVTPEQLQATANDLLGVLSVWGYTPEQAGLIVVHMAAILTTETPETFAKKIFEKK